MEGHKRNGRLNYLYESIEINGICKTLQRPR